MTETTSYDLLAAILTGKLLNRKTFCFSSQMTLILYRHRQ